MDRLPPESRFSYERPFQFRLWHLFVVMTVLAIVLAALAQFGEAAICPLFTSAFVSLAICSLLRRDGSLIVIGELSFWSLRC